MADDGENVTRLPVRFKTQGKTGRALELIDRYFDNEGQCSHRNATFIVCESEADVECGKCGAKLNPMWVLKHLAVEERRLHEMSERYKDEMKRLSERSRTQCQHCGKMTRISRR